MVEANANNAKVAAYTANNHIQVVRDAIIQTNKDLRRWIIKQLQKNGFITGDYQGINHEGMISLQNIGPAIMVLAGESQKLIERR